MYVLVNVKRIDIRARPLGYCSLASGVATGVASALRYEAIFYHAFDVVIVVRRHAKCRNVNTSGMVLSMCIFTISFLNDTAIVYCLLCQFRVCKQHVP